MQKISKKQNLEELKNKNEFKEYVKQIQNKEDRLKNLVGPIESYIRLIECILTWDYPIVFILLVITVHIGFLLYYLARVALVFSVGGFICLFVHVFAAYIHSAENDDSIDGWVQVQSRDEGQFDLIHCIACIIVKFENLYSSCREIKRTDRDKFCILGICFFLALFVVSCFLKDITLVYILVMFILFWPGLKYNKLTDKFVAFTTPYILSLERTFRIKRSINPKKFRKQLKKKLKGHKNDNKFIEEDTDKDGGGDDSDADLKEFIPNENSFPSLSDDKLNIDNKNVILDDDDDSDAGEFLPKTSMVLDSRDASDDEFLPKDSNFSSKILEDTLDSINLNRSAANRIKHDVGDDDNTGDEKDYDNDEVNVDIVTKSKTVKDKLNKAEDDKTDDGFTDGLSFDNVDSDVVDDKNKNLNSMTNYLIGGLLNPATITQNIPDAAVAVMNKAFSGLNMLKNTLGSVMSSSQPVEGSSNKESQLVDNEFDFLRQEELDDFDDN